MKFIKNVPYSFSYACFCLQPVVRREIQQIQKRMQPVRRLL